jgi:hypothetical protein
MWEYDAAADTWTEITAFQDGQRPSPRGGAMMAFYGGEYYKRAAPNYGSTKRDRIVLFGGTDGKNYYNDTWVFDRNFPNYVLANQQTFNRWYVADPGGEQSRGPSPRAFGSMVYAQNGGLREDPLGLGPYGITDLGANVAASASVLLFGGRTGTLPGGPDTDRDLVDDGHEYELGGVGAGRDPRVNALVNPNGLETVPFNIKPWAASVGALPYVTRAHIADLEVMSYPERGESWRAGLFTWQGWPIETTYTSEYYVIGDETEVPFETPYPDRVVFQTGVDALVPDWTNLWYHRYPLGLGTPRDPRDAWELGIPSNVSPAPTSAPPYAYSGRWVYGTKLTATYPNDAIMELYSPIFDLTVPDPYSIHQTNHNSYFLMFHEWLDLADSNDIVRVDLIRPGTPADVNTRVSGLSRPGITLVANRNASANTAGSWRRVLVPLDVAANESNLYVRFTMQSDSNNVRGAGGWYLDDFAIIQGAEISGVLAAPPGTEVCLIGENFNNHEIDCTPTDGDGGFDFGLLPLGNYQVVALGVTNGPYALSSPDIEITLSSPAPAPEFTDISLNSPLKITWTATNGLIYRLDYTTNLLMDAWVPMDLQTGGLGGSLTYTDLVATPDRIYRVVVTNSP